MSGACPGWCGQCYENKRGRANHKGHWGYRRPRKPWVPRCWEMRDMKRPEKAGGADGAEGEPGKGDAFAHLPSLWEMLTATKYEDGSKRVRMTLLVLFDGPTVKLWANDRTEDRSAWAAGGTLEEALEALDRQIEEGTVSWRAGDGKRGKK